MNLETRGVWRFVTHGLALIMVCALTSSALAASQDAQLEPRAFVRTKDGGAKLYNLPDKNSVALTQFAPRALLAVYADRVGYLSVEPASGFEAWIYGQYVRATDQPGVLEITGNNVLMRPLPSSTQQSFPLEQRLHKGDRVRVSARADAQKDVKEDWIQIYAPPGTRAWVLAADTQPVDAKEDVKSAWAAANKDALAARKTVELPVSAPRADAKNTAVDPAAAATSDKLAAADALLNTAKSSANPDFAPARAAYQKVLDENSKGVAADTARQRLDEIDARQEIQRIKADSAMFEEKRKAELEKADARLREVSLNRDPLWGRFQARGWLERVATPGAATRYVVRWGGNTVADVVCTSGRYDLDTFLGSEVGLIGVTVRSAVAQSGANEAQPARIDATRLEVISGRNNER